MKRIRSAIKLFVVVFCTAALITAEPPNLNVGTVALAAGEVDQLYFSLGGAIAKAAEATDEGSGIRILVETTEGAVDNIKRVSAGRNEFGIAPAYLLGQALAGIGEWEESGAQSRLRNVFTLYLETVALAVSAESDIRTIEDLRGRVVNIGGAGSTSRLMATAIMEGAGIDWKSEITPYAFEPEDIGPLIAEGSVDAMFIAGGSPLPAVADAGAVRFIPLFADSIELPPELYLRTSSIAVDHYDNVENRNDVESIGMPVVLLSSDEIDPHVTYVATSVLLDRIKQLGKLEPTFSALSLDLAGSKSVGVKHSGAERYFDEAAGDN